MAFDEGFVFVARLSLFLPADFVNGSVEIEA
jgi:hypothetical protein